MLDLDAGAGIADIREAYRLQVRTWNPDHPAYDVRVRAAAERRLADVRQAYEWLKANGDAVVAQATGVAALPSNEGGASTQLSVVTYGFFYLVLVGLLVFGIGVMANSNPNAWFGPLVTPTTYPITLP